MSTRALATPAPTLTVETLVDRGIPRERAALSFAPTPELSAFATQAVAGRTQPLSRARSLFQAIDHLMTGRSIVADKDNTPKAREPLTASELWQASQQGKHPLAGCYELTALYIAMARSVGLDVRGAEEIVHGSGAIGHIVAIISDGGLTTAIDLQNRSFAKAERIKELSDLELAAHHYNHRAVAAYLAGDIAAATVALNDGMALASSVPQLWSNRAATWAAQKDFSRAIADAQHAITIAPDVAVYYYQLGAVRIASGAYCDGLHNLGQALQRDAHYADAKMLVRSTLEAHPQLTCATLPGEP